MKRARTPEDFGKIVLVSGIGAMMAAMLFGPALSPAEFDWVRHTTSEQAAQGMAGAWIMRFGFLAFGMSVVATAVLPPVHGAMLKGALILFGLGLVAAATWSNAPIIAGVPVDDHEDILHSIASGFVGTAFAAACAARLFAPGGRLTDRLAWGGLIVSVAVPMAMTAFPDCRGLLQRAMFCYSFIFLLREVR